MKKNILIFGSIAGLIVSINMVIMAIKCHNNTIIDFSGSMILGFTSMIIAFSFIFVGIKNYRDKFNEGIISFGKAFKIGALIALIASTLYVIVWLIVFYNFIPDFMENYTAHVINKAKTDGTSATALKEIIVKMNSSKEMYKNPVNVIWMTYGEILPIGLVIALIAALVMKRKYKKDTLSVS